ncbi:WD repeat domain-containing protein 83 [Thelohanellus kitauei]|uniref:WD repeat domain-containing protein 83 n=1 Tax=Thelohanellus kitauei TaxID=669202 RepID=A0A0C2J9Q8_THEKT|nr:WD repeat domain-containing protein 83 [Thelohanellus kitauei]
MYEHTELDVPWNLYKSCSSRDFGAIRSVRFNEDGTYCMTGGSDKAIRLWNPVKGLLLKTYLGHGQDVLDVAASFDSSQLASGSKDQVIMIWDVVTGHTIRRMREHYGPVNCVVYNLTESSILVTGSTDSKCHMWDMRTRGSKPVQSLEDAKDTIMSITTSDHEIITASIDCFLRVYDIRRAKLVSDCLGKAVGCCSESRDKLSILCSCLDSKIRLMDKESGSLLNSYGGHKNNEFKIESTFLTNDSYVVSGSEDGRLVYWDLITSEVVKQIPAHKGAVVSLSYSKKLNRLVTASSDGISLWIGNEEPRT